MIPVEKVARSNWLRTNNPTNKSSKTKRKSICGFGINDADYVVNPKINGNRVPCPAYSTWRDMVQRCADDNYKEKHPCYVRAELHPDWKSFMVFREWWSMNFIEGCEIDKDLLSGQYKLYGPDTCVFIPRWLNVFLTARDGYDTPKGVFFEKDRSKFKASVRHEGRTLNIGRFDTLREANEAYVAKKMQIALSRFDEIESIRPGLFDKVSSLIKEGR